MDLKQLEYFVRVAEFGSFTRAAAFLGVAQPALSRQIRLLEVELRQSLLIRNGRGATATDAGKLLLSHGLGILQQVERVRNALEEQRGATVGRVAIGMPPSAGRLLTVATVREFQQRFPKAALGIVEGLSTNILEWLQVGRIDIGLVYNPTPSPEIETEPLMEEALYLMRPASGGKGRKFGKPVRLAELPQYPLMIPGRPHAIRMLIETRMANAGLRINVKSEVGSVPAILDLVAQDLGYAVLSLNALQSNQMEGRVQPCAIVEPSIATVLALATSSQRPATPLVSRTMDLLRELAQAHSGRAAGSRGADAAD